MLTDARMRRKKKGLSGFVGMMGVLMKQAVSEAVAEIHDKADSEPDKKPHPCNPGQAAH